MTPTRALRKYTVYQYEPPHTARKVELEKATRDRLKAQEESPEGAPKRAFYTTKTAARRAYQDHSPVAARASREGGKVAKRLERAGEQAAERVVRSAGRNAGRIATAAGTAVAVAAQMVAAAAVGYFLGDITSSAFRGMGKAEKQAAVDQAYRSARRRMADELGRAPTPDEFKPLTAAWRDASARIAANEPLSRASRSW